jgi:hypothetical protein
MISEMMRPKERSRIKARLIPHEDGRHTVCGGQQPMGQFCRDGLILLTRHNDEYLIPWSEIGRIIALYATQK